MARLDYDRAAGNYRATRASSLVQLEPWRHAIAAHLPTGRPCVLDVGAGTGVWARALTAWFDAMVIAVEPSRGMREQAGETSARVGAHWIGGRAEHLPVRTEVASAAWLSTVIHHISDLEACAVELRRALEPGAPVLIRSSFPGRHDEIPLFRLFPAAARVASTFPTVEETTAAFAVAGFEAVGLERVRDAVAPSLEDARARLPAMRHADSTLASLTNSEFEQGLRNLDAAIAAGEEPSPIGLDLLVLRSPARR